MEHPVKMDNDDDDIYAVGEVCSSSCIDLHYFSLLQSVYMLIVYVLFSRYKNLCHTFCSLSKQAQPDRQSSGVIYFSLKYCIVSVYTFLCPPVRLFLLHSSLASFSFLVMQNANFLIIFSPRLLNKM